MPSETNSPPVPSHEWKPRKHRRNPLDLIRLGIEVIALFGLALYVCETRRTNGLTQQALTFSKQQFTQEQAPYVWITPDNPVIKAEEHILWDINFSNYGHSPAFNVRHCGFYAWGRNGNNARSALKPMTLADCVKFGLPIQGTGTVIPPGYSQLFTIRTNEIFHEIERPYFNTVDGYFLTEGVFEYEDRGGKKYRSVFCVERLATGAANFCDQYNYIQPVE